MTRITVIGAPGRMGQTILATLDSTDTLVQAVGKPGSSAIGSTLLQKYTVVETLSETCDVVVDFAAGPGFAELALHCADRSIPLVSGRTGLSPEDEEALERVSETIAVLHAGNMSLGANLMTLLAAQAAAAVPQADLEILETHHVHKADAPSGTALMVADAAAQARGLGREAYVYGRQGQTGEKPEGAIGIHAIRSGETVGQHAAWFGLPGERIEIVHHAQDRSIFARGALTAARWIVGRDPGRYSMRDVLGL